MYNDKGPWTFQIFVIGLILSEYPSKALRHYLPLSKLTTHRLEVATQFSSTTFTKHFSWYSVWKYRLCVVVLCSTHAKVKHKKITKYLQRGGSQKQCSTANFSDETCRWGQNSKLREPKSKVFESPKEGASSLEMKPKKCSSRIYTLVWKEFPSKSFAIKKRETSLSLACLLAYAKTNIEK